MSQLLSLAQHHHQSGRLAEAAKLYQQILSADPGQPIALHMLGVIAGQRGQWEIAVQLIQESLRHAPDVALAHSNLGKLFFDRQRFAESIACCQEAVRLDPDLAEAHFNLGNALYSAEEIDEAIVCFQRAIALRPAYTKVHHNLANAYKDRAELDLAVASARRVVELCPQIPEAHSNLIFTMLFHPGIDPPAIRDECGRWNQRHARPLMTPVSKPSHAIPQHRSVRIGYVSPNFRAHCQSLLTMPLLSHHDHRRFHITLYSDVRRGDAITQRLRLYADQWHDTAALSDAALAALVRQDEIDILVDLTMHMANNRLLMFAQQSAPHQVCWLAYPGTTGLSAMQFRLTDPWLDPPPDASGGHERFYSEASLRLADTFWCYDPLSEIAINPLPALARGHLTFGCLNNFCKITDQMRRAWADILRAVPLSRLLLLAPKGMARTHVRDAFSAAGVSPERIDFADFSPRQKYLERYHEIDLALDTFPVNGHTTSLDALWMGVPVVTLVHPENALGRAGLSQLSNLDAHELIAYSPEAYVRIAVELARNHSRLAEYRAMLRGRMQRSPLMDGVHFTRQVESAFSQIVGE